MKSIFSFREAYLEYVNECMAADESVWTFRAWWISCYLCEYKQERAAMSATPVLQAKLYGVFISLVLFVRLFM